jgi:hypothetical protein
VYLEMLREAQYGVRTIYLRHCRTCVKRTQTFLLFFLYCITAHGMYELCLKLQKSLYFVFIIRDNTYIEINIESPLKRGA